ncbi:hypothetical protein D5S18_24120 [Nocardia panacis]|uniref:ESX-1 secretion-associated protein n=1 Tax=Nocardia panacis TaxID=2340916 RepID=A0A3A4KFW1_9NOCA|nr:hypothetical protein [Nocardia panacis]RJO72246.1 hypothetical protein D5S18_24120 [Nocardia panacis]
MRKMLADTQGIAAYAAHAETMSGELAAAAAGAVASDPLALASIFGAIGGDFLAAYTATHAGHTAAIGQLSAVVGSMSGGAAAAASTLTETDAAHAAAMGQAAAEMAG